MWQLGLSQPFFRELALGQDTQAYHGAAAVQPDHLRGSGWPVRHSISEVLRVRNVL